MSTLYCEEILEHFRNPQNYGQLSGADIVVEEVNPLCGDKQTWYIRITENTKTRKHEKTIQDIKFTSTGCALSTAAASLLSEKLKGQPLGQLRELTEADMIALLGVKVGPSRTECVLLPLLALKKGIETK